jgi:glycosyltransferase involved in cell wall biosynthesis
MISLITPTQGNPIALLRTIESVKDICDEVVVGDVIPFEEDRKLIESYGVKLISLPLNFIALNGFSYTLNWLANHAKNDKVLYLNVGEIIGNGENILENITDEYNAWYIDHLSERHRWWRCYNRHEMEWSGLIHEEIVGDWRPFHKPIFTFADTEKDTVDAFKGKVMNDIKESVYWTLLCKLVDDNSLLAATNEGWLGFAESQYDSMKERLAQKGKRYDAFIAGDLNGYLNEVMNSPEFEKERFDSNTAIEYQGSPMYLGKK